MALNLYILPEMSSKQEAKAGFLVDCEVIGV